MTHPTITELKDAVEAAHAEYVLTGDKADLDILNEAKQALADAEELKSFQRDILPELSVRKAAKLIGIAPATFHRFRSGENVDFETAKTCSPYMKECPCCGRNRRPQAGQGVRVKPLVWIGFNSGQYEIAVEDGRFVTLYDHGNRVEDNGPEIIKSGYLTLVSIADLKAAAQAHHENHILAALETAPDMTIKQAAMEKAYLAGFRASAEGYNMECPFDQKKVEPQTDANWCVWRDKALKAIAETDE
jgi:hypothetical protein